MKRIYEILEECKMQESVQDIQRVLLNYDTPALRQVLKCAYFPGTEWYFDSIPEDYKKPDTLPGVAISDLYTEVNRLYIFCKGHPIADSLSQQKRKELFLQLIEGMEPDEAQVVVDVMRGDLQIDGLNKETINQIFPNLIN
jgi:hypothetical protein